MLSEEVCYDFLRAILWGRGGYPARGSREVTRGRSGEEALPRRTNNRVIRAPAFFPHAHHSDTRV